MKKTNYLNLSEKGNKLKVSGNIVPNNLKFLKVGQKFLE